MIRAKEIVIIAGPNGAGKTTFAREVLPKEALCANFINADLIAAGLSPFHPELAAMRSARLVLESIREHVRAGRGFALESTLSGRTYARMIPEWRRAGYYVTLFFLEIPTAEIAVQRVALRVSQGGHDIPEADIRRRFVRPAWIPLADEALKRAALRAREVAIQTNTGIVVMIEGKMVQISAAELRAERDRAAASSLGSEIPTQVRASS